MAEFFYRWTPAALAAVTLWAFPLAALWRRGAAGPPSGWVRWVVVPCLVGTAGFTAATLGIRMLVHLGVAEEFRRPDLLAFAHWSIAAAVVLQGIVAAVVTAGLYRAHGCMAGLFGLMAAFVTGCLATVALFGGIVLGGCWDVFALVPGPCAVDLEVSFVRDTLLRIVVAGTASAVVGAGAAAAVGSWWARRRIPGAPPVSVAVSRRQRAVLGLAALLAVGDYGTGGPYDDGHGPTPLRRPAGGRRWRRCPCLQEGRRGHGRRGLHQQRGQERQPLRGRTTRRRGGKRRAGKGDSGSRTRRTNG